MPSTCNGTLSLALSTFLVLAAGACAASGSAEGDGDTADSATAAQAPHNTLTAAERDAGWRLLFDGESLAGWRGYESETPPEGWRAENGALYRFGPGGDIMTVDEFGDFELALDWKISEGGNSGILYRAKTGSEAIYESAPEMQVLDDERQPDGQSPLTSAGSDYGLYPAPRGVVKPAGEWNHVRIVVHGNHVEHWMNGEKVVEYELHSPEWNEKVANSKFAQWPEYGQAREGHIGLQDHGSEVWYRDIKIRPLGDEEAGS